MKKKKGIIREWVESFLIAFVLAMIIKTYIIQAYKIPTGSMIPTLNIGNRLLANKFIYRFREPKRGDVIIFGSDFPADKGFFYKCGEKILRKELHPKKDFIKRLIGLPGETVEIKNGFIYINDKRIDIAVIRKNHYTNIGPYGSVGDKIYVPEDSYFVLGDNSPNSQDSRYWGFVPKKKVKGNALLVFWPLNKMRLIK